MNLEVYSPLRLSGHPAFDTSYLKDNIRGIRRATEMVHQCCWMMMDAYVVAYQDYLALKKA
jgi:hypothetical protein